MAIEDVFYALNVKSALKFGQVRGVACWPPPPRDLKSPNTLRSRSSRPWWATDARKSSKCSAWLPASGLPRAAGTMDASDALAIAICHLHTTATLAGNGRSRRWPWKTRRHLWHNFHGLTFVGEAAREPSTRTSSHIPRQGSHNVCPKHLSVTAAITIRFLGSYSARAAEQPTSRFSLDFPNLTRSTIQSPCSPTGTPTTSPSARITKDSDDTGDLPERISVIAITRARIFDLAAQAHYFSGKIDSGEQEAGLHRSQETDLYRRRAEYCRERTTTPRSRLSSS